MNSRKFFRRRNSKSILLKQATLLLLTSFPEVFKKNDMLSMAFLISDDWNLESTLFVNILPLRLYERFMSQESIEKFFDF